MGTYSYYRLGIADDQHQRVSDETRKYLVQALFNHSSEASWALTIDGERNREAKWYDACEEMIKFSTKHDKYFFALGTLLSEGDDTESYNLFYQGKVFEISEPDFMQTPVQPALFDSEEALIAASTIDQNNEEYLFMLSSAKEADTDFWLAKLQQTMFGQKCKKSMRVYPWGAMYNIYVVLTMDVKDAFLAEARRVLVSPERS